MSYSLNELEALAKRAVRGVGYSWGLAEDAGGAIRWLAAFGLPGPAQLCALLTMNDGETLSRLAPERLTGIWRARGSRLCPLIAGASLSDCAHLLHRTGSVILEQVACPLLICPYAANVASSLGDCIRIRWAGFELITDGQCLQVIGNMESINARQVPTLQCRLGAVPFEPAAPGFRAELSGDTWEQLNSFSQRTYAPATEESRQRGAGAGTSDND